MKTSVNMIRVMGDFTVTQRTEDGYFDANNLLKQWNGKHKKKEMNKFLFNIKTQQFIEEIVERESHVEKNRHADIQPVKTIKGRVTVNGKIPDKVFMHPFLFIDFAMWLNSKFKYYVIKFVYDQLIEFRHAAGDTNNILRYAVASKWHPLPEYFRSLNIGLNHIVFNDHKRGMRNSATQEQLDDLNNLQKIYVYNIDSSLIESEENLLLELRKEYVRRHVPDHKTLQT